MLNKPALAFIMMSTAIGAIAQTVTEIHANKGRSAYIEDSQGNIMRTPFGHCWRSALWTPADAVAGCDGDLKPPIANPTAPAIVANPAPVVPAASAPNRCDFIARLEGAELFKPAGAKLSAAGKKRMRDRVLNRIAACNKLDNVKIEAFAAPGPRAGRKLAQARAKAVAAYLKSEGLEAPVSANGRVMAGCGRAMHHDGRMPCASPAPRVEITVLGTQR
jgi:OOP family OmpA-OmpF porin